MLIIDFTKFHNITDDYLENCNVFLIALTLRKIGKNYKVTYSAFACGGGPRRRSNFSSPIDGLSTIRQTTNAVA